MRWCTKNKYLILSHCPNGGRNRYPCPRLQLVIPLVILRWSDQSTAEYCSQLMLGDDCLLYFFGCRLHSPACLSGRTEEWSSVFWLQVALACMSRAFGLRSERVFPRNVYRSKQNLHICLMKHVHGLLTIWFMYNDSHTCFNMFANICNIKGDQF